MIGIAIIAQKRWLMLMRLLASLEASESLDRVTVHLFQDGAVNVLTGKRTATDEDIARSIQVFEESNLPHKELHEQEGNVGMLLNQLYATDYLAEHYSRLIVMENDTVLSPHFLTMAHHLFDDLEDQPDTFCFSPGFRRACSLGMIDKHLSELRPTWGHTNCECFLTRSLMRIRHLDTFEEYHRLVINQEPSLNQKIRELFTRTGWLGGLSATQDNMRNVAINEIGMRRMMMIVNRAINIGSVGTHFNARLFHQMGFDGQTPYIFESDATREDFTWL